MRGEPGHGSNFYLVVPAIPQTPEFFSLCSNGFILFSRPEGHYPNPPALAGEAWKGSGRYEQEINGERCDKSSRCSQAISLLGPPNKRDLHLFPYRTVPNAEAGSPVVFAALLATKSAMTNAQRRKRVRG